MSKYQVDSIVNAADDGAPDFPNGITIASNAVKSAPSSEIKLRGATGVGSVGNRTRTFGSTNLVTTGTDITYTVDNTNGDTFTVNADGVYSMSYTDRHSTGFLIAITVNSTSTISLNAAETVMLTNTTVAEREHMSVTVRLSSGDVIRCQTNVALTSQTGDSNFFIITQVAKF